MSSVPQSSSRDFGSFAGSRDDFGASQTVPTISYYPLYSLRQFAYPGQPVRLPPSRFPAVFPPGLTGHHVPGPQMRPRPATTGPLEAQRQSQGRLSHDTLNPQDLRPGNIPQVDGGDDDEELPAQGQSTDSLAVTNGEDAVDKPAGEDELGSDLDDDEDHSNEEEEIDDLLLCLYEKVNRTRNKWKCNFKSGIVNIGGHDFAFTRLNGDFEW